MHNQYLYAWHDSFICVPCRIHKSRHSKTWFIENCDTINSCRVAMIHRMPYVAGLVPQRSRLLWGSFEETTTGHDSFICGTWLIHMGGMTKRHGWQNSFMYVFCKHCNTVQQIATHSNTATHCNTLQHTATYCNTLQHVATHCNTLQFKTHRNTLQRTANQNTLQHNATHLQSFAVCCSALSHSLIMSHIHICRYMYTYVDMQIYIYTYIYIYI